MGPSADRVMPPRPGPLRAVGAAVPLEPALPGLAIPVLLASPDGLDQALRQSLAGLARLLGVDRCGIAQFTNDGRSLVWTHGFAVPGIPPYPAVDVSPQLPWYTEQVRQGRTLVLPSLPEGVPAASPDAEFVAASGLRSHLTVPLKVGADVLGGLGMGSFHRVRCWTPQLVSSLELLAGIFASALQRLHAAERLRAAEKLSRCVLAAVPDPLLVLDADGRVAHVSRAWASAPACLVLPDVVAPGADFLEALHRAPAERHHAAEAVLEGIRSVLARKSERFETVYQCPRPPLDCHCRVAVTAIEGGGAAIIRTDVSALERARADLERRGQEVSELKDRLAADSAHALKRGVHAHVFDDIVGTSAALARTLRQVEQVAAADSPVLILGETGTGKDLVARAIHARSGRKDGPLVAVNCAALPDALIESELFGYERGAFTGAVARTFGRFEVADGGSILLDEIGDMPLAVQAKLLRVLEHGSFERLGSSKTIQVNVRVIAATNRDLEHEVRVGRFRADLYYRLNVFPIVVPALRERSEDVPLLVWHFIAARQGPLGRKIDRVPERLMRALQDYSWPGNVRELENLIERALIVSDGPTLSVDAPLLAAATGEPPPGASLDDVQRAHIESVLRQCGWRISGKGNAAERLGVKRGTLQFRMRKLGIRRPS